MFQHKSCHLDPEWKSDGYNMTKPLASMSQDNQ